MTAQHQWKYLHLSKEPNGKSMSQNTVVHCGWRCPI